MEFNLKEEKNVNNKRRRCRSMSGTLKSSHLMFLLKKYKFIAANHYVLYFYRIIMRVHFELRIMRCLISHTVSPFISLRLIRLE